MTNESDASQAIWLSSLSTCLFCVAASLAEMFIWHKIPEVTRWQWVQALLVNLVALAIVLAGRRRWSVSLATSLFLLQILSVNVPAWVTYQELAWSGRVFEPFQANKLGVIAIALIAPARLWLGLASILFTGFAAVVEYFTWSADIRARMPPQEPWVALTFALLACLLLWHRVRRLAIEREMARAQTEAAALQRLARTFLAVRDLANTPAQTIALNTALLRTRRPDAAVEVGRIERALVQLRGLSRILAAGETLVGWREGDESLDAIEVLQRSLSSRAEAQ